jgi:light-regulated signal transduction histidine kinase (bacteriophytochrome)
LATYTNLSPGTYIFHVKASNNDRIWNEKGTSIKIIISPPYWKTWWFRGMVMVILLVMIITVFWLRIRNLENKGKEFELLVAKRTSQLELANKELEAFSYSVSHDLRTPLRGIDGFSRILLEKANDKLDKLEQSYLSRIRNGAQQMSQLIDDILKLSRVIRSEMNIREVNLSSIANEIANDYQNSDAGRKVKFIIQKGIIVNADERLLRIAIENLIGNAWKFTSKHLSACIEFGKYRKGENIIYYVRDDGAGFDMEYSQKLFGAFQRLHSSQDYSGTGIGLATVQRIIHRHGGSIWAEGEEEKGATFYFSIPWNNK